MTAQGVLDVIPQHPLEKKRKKIGTCLCVLVSVMEVERIPLLAGAGGDPSPAKASATGNRLSRTARYAKVRPFTVALSTGENNIYHRRDNETG